MAAEQPPHEWAVVATDADSGAPVALAALESTGQTPTQTPTTLAVRSSSSSNDLLQALTLIVNHAANSNGGGAESMQLARLQQPRNSFQMLADKEFFSNIVSVACYLDALRFYRRGKERFKVFTFSFIRDAFCRALSEADASSSSEKPFNIDQWYFEMLGTHKDPAKAHEAQFGTEDPDETRLHEMGTCRGEHQIDWIGALQKLEITNPGFVLALSSGIEQQNLTQERVAVEFRRAIDYGRGDQAAPNIGKTIYKSARQPISNSGGGATRSRSRRILAVG